MKQLYKGMIFKNSIEAMNYLGVEPSRASKNYRILSRYCLFHKENNNTIYIDEVFNTISNYRSGDFKLKEGELVNTKTGQIKILSTYKKSKNSHINKFCLCKCLIHNYIFEKKEHHILQGVGCPICGKRSVVSGYRSLYDQCPEVLKYLKCPDEAKNVTFSSSKKILCKCPDCGAERSVVISNLTKHGFSCYNCSDRVSYPNKFIREVLNQLNVNYIPEKSFNWSEGRRYDQFLTDNNIIIENHGIQHYEDSLKFHTTAKNQQAIDNFKRDIAIKNGVSHYIELDCRYSNMEYIKRSIMNSLLPALLSFSEKDINWDYCNTIACKSLIKEICEKWKENKNISILAEEFSIDPHTAIDYLIRGASMGYCTYEKYSNINGRNIAFSRGRYSRCKPIYCQELNAYFFSKHECAQYFKSELNIIINPNYLYTPINLNRSYKGFHFSYISKEFYNKMKEESLQDSSIVCIGDFYPKQYIGGENNEQI